MTDQQTIERAIIGKRVVAVSWLPIAIPGGAFELESITLENGTKLELSVWLATFGARVVAEIEESEDANT